MDHPQTEPEQVAPPRAKATAEIIVFPGVQYARERDAAGDLGQPNTGTVQERDWLRLED